MKNLKMIAKILLVLVVFISIIIIGSAIAFFYENFERDLKEQDTDIIRFLTGNIKEKTGEKEVIPNFTCLVMGRNAHLTDYIVICQYNPNTREISLLSVPRDTNVGTSSVDGKINSIYMGKYPEKVVAKVEEITGLNIDHYLVFDTSVLKKVVNVLGGVTVNVPINMNYDDPYQNLYIHLNKGTQELDGAKAEQFVRFRKNNDGTGYIDGDIGRIKAQQQFVKALISEILKAENLSKINDMIKVVLEGTKTDLTKETISEYIDDIVTIKMDRIRMDTLPGTAKYAMSPNGYNLSYYFYDAIETKQLVKELFLMSKEEVEKLNSSSGDISKSGDDKKEQELPLNTSEDDEDLGIRVEILNANAKISKLNDLVEKLNNNECNVVKIGNYATTKNEYSRIITYGKNTVEELAKIKELSGIKTIEESEEKTNVKFTIIIGSAY